VQDTGDVSLNNHTCSAIGFTLRVSGSENEESCYVLSQLGSNMPLHSRNRSIPQVWRAAILGTIAALPATIIMNWSQNAEASIGGGVMIVGSLIAGAVAANRSIKPGAAGLRGGFLGGVGAVAIFLLTEGTAVVSSLNMTVFFLIAVVMLLGASLVFGMIFGRIGGWVANTVGGFSINQTS